MREYQPKKMLIINILNILRRYSDADHRLSQKDIMEILQNEYGMTAERKAVKRNLMNLLDCGYPLEFSESVRRTRDGEEETISGLTASATSGSRTLPPSPSARSRAWKTAWICRATWRSMSICSRARAGA